MTKTKIIADVRKILFSILLAGAVFTLEPVQAQKSLSLTYTVDSRAYQGIKFAGFTKELPLKLKLSAFTDLDSEFGTRDLSKYYLEPSVSRVFSQGFGINGELNSSSGRNNDNLRIGPCWSESIKGINIFLKYLPLNSQRGQQISLFFSRDSKNWYVQGFFDYNLVPGKNRILSEIWGGRRIVERLSFGLEARLNQFIKKPKGIGLILNYNF